MEFKNKLNKLTEDFNNLNYKIQNNFVEFKDQGELLRAMKLRLNLLIENYDKKRSADI